jgi:hypothetical protein
MTNRAIPPHPWRRRTLPIARSLRRAPFTLGENGSRKEGRLRFALVERSARRQERTAEPVLELVLATGERLRIGLGVDITTLGTVLDVLRG